MVRTRVRPPRRAVWALALTICVAVVSMLPQAPASAFRSPAAPSRLIRPVAGSPLRDAPRHARVERTPAAFVTTSPGVPGAPGAYAAVKSAAASTPADPAQRLADSPASRAPSAPVVIDSFAGIGHNASFTLDPPDTIVAASPDHVVEAVNSRLRLTDEAGGDAVNKTLNAFFGATTSDGIAFDPKVYYDRDAANPRFFVVALQLLGLGDADPANDLSRILLAVSRSPDPSTLGASGWCRYFIDSRRDVGTADASGADFPGLGAGPRALVITTNNFRFAPPVQFTYSIARVLNKVRLENNAGSCPAGSSVPIATFQPSTTLTDDSAFTLQPAQHYTRPSSFVGSANPTYLVSGESAGGPSAAYRVWRIRNFPGASPTMDVVEASGNFTYGPPPDAPGGAGGNFDTGDPRILQVAGVGNSLTAVQTTACQMGVGAAEACVRVVRIRIGQDGSGAVTASIGQQATFGGGDDDFLFYPAVAVNDDKSTAVAYQRSSASLPLSAQWTAKTASESSFGSALDLGPSGECAMNVGFDANRGAYRAGDYSGAQTDPDGDAFWLAGERAATFADCRWATEIARVTV